MNTQEFLAEVSDTFAECQNIIIKKNSDYANSGDPFKNFNMSTQVGVSPERAILVRISDKISRISNLLERKSSVLDERLEDTIMDCANYLIILKALIKSKEHRGEEDEQLPRQENHTTKQLGKEYIITSL